MKYTIQPCPFCAGDMTEVVTDDSENFAVLCGDCQAQGPAGSDEHHAVKFWNSREY